MNAVVKPLVRYQREHMADIWDELLPLFELHYREIAHYQDIPLAPDRAFYLEADRLGLLRAYTVRAIDGLLVGYVTLVVRTNPHYATSVQAVADLLYLHPDHRRGRAGVGLIRYAEDQLRREGVQVVMHHVKIAHPRLGEILRRGGYIPIDTLYAKRLDR
jgi:GNAT superfamily N-acetyltransferase